MVWTGDLGLDRLLHAKAGRAPLAKVKDTPLLKEKHKKTELFIDEPQSLG